MGNQLDTTKSAGQACSTWGGTGGLAGMPMGTRGEQLMLMMLVPRPEQRAKLLPQDAQGEQLMLMMLAPRPRKTKEKHRLKRAGCKRRRGAADAHDAGPGGAHHQHQL